MTPAASALYYQAIAGEMVRRATGRRSVGVKGTSSDADLWVPREVWEEVVDRVTSAMLDLHRAAAAPRTAGKLRVSATTALFEMCDTA